MTNFYADNPEIGFLFKHLPMAHAAQIVEEGFRFHQEFDFAPKDAADAIDNYERILKSLGELAGEVIAPTAEETDKLGNTLNPDGSVTRPPGIDKAITLLGQADLMGFTLPYRFGGLNCPTVVYTMSNDIVSRADASLMNIYGLQGIAETINAFASEQIKQQYLPNMANGKWTGAMVLTEPDAGSDLQSVKTRAYQDEKGNWFVHGVKRFITNGCGEILLVLARTEPEITDGRGLSLLLVERGPKVKVRRLENKLGIHGSPTCEIFFDDAPAKLIGERQRGLITYVMSLMNGARVGIAAQSLGIGEAAYRVARDYAHSRKQFETAIENFPAVRDLLVQARVDLSAARTLTYYGSYSVDIENGALRTLEFGQPTEEQKKLARAESRKYGRFNKLLTPMSKYYASEMSMRLANTAIAILGGSGYMKDYPVERHLRDSRITTIYEGTSQLQVVAGVAGVTSGTCQMLLEELLSKSFPQHVAPYVDEIRHGMAMLTECVEFIKTQSPQCRDLYARKLVDMGLYLVVGALFCDQAAASMDRLPTLKYWMQWRMPELRMDREMILSNHQEAITEFDAIAGPVPAAQ